MNSTPPTDWPFVAFPESIVSLLIGGSLVLSGLGAFVLIVLLIKDFKSKNIW